MAATGEEKHQRPPLTPNPIPPHPPPHLAVWGQVAGTAAWMQSRLWLFLHVQSARRSTWALPTEAEGVYLLEDDVNVTSDQLRDLLSFSGLY